MRKVIFHFGFAQIAKHTIASMIAIKTGRRRGMLILKLLDYEMNLQRLVEEKIVSI